MNPTRYWIDRSKVVHDVFEDGEVAVINLLTGRYYSLTGSAPALWPRLVDGATIGELAAFAEASFTPTATSVLRAVEAFVATLELEGLVDTNDTGASDVVAPTAPEATGARVASDALPPFTEPLIERFDDLEELILLDPVHDVGDLGWPHAAAG